MKLQPESVGLFSAFVVPGFVNPMFVLVHLKSGDLLGGHWGGRSYADSFPNDGDIYLEAVCDVDDRGRFGERLPHTRGVLLTRNEYSYLQLFEVPEEA